MRNTLYDIFTWMFVIGSWYAFVLLIRDIYNFIFPLDEREKKKESRRTRRKGG